VKNNSPNTKTFLSVYTTNIAELLNGEVCQGPLSKTELG